MSKYAISYDIGTTGVKTCIFELGDTIKLVMLSSYSVSNVLTGNVAIIES